MFPGRFLVTNIAFAPGPAMFSGLACTDPVIVTDLAVSGRYVCMVDDGVSKVSGGMASDTIVLKSRMARRRFVAIAA